ncbi:MAG: twin-arginine translocase TatA/TatE family subunit [Candidatus Hydrogenedentes bacterium]|nr:twin-arginine translocase TatA/TatE family subunit [Candidatus Hydrogenedentota bacterium]
MFGIGSWEMMILLVIVLIIFGAGKLPTIGRSLGQAITEFKSSVKEKDEEPIKKDSTEEPK